MHKYQINRLIRLEVTEEQYKTLVKMGKCKKLTVEELIKFIIETSINSYWGII